MKLVVVCAVLLCTSSSPGKYSVLYSFFKTKPVIKYHILYLNRQNTYYNEIGIQKVVTVYMTLYLYVFKNRLDKRCTLFLTQLCSGELLGVKKDNLIS